MSPKSRAIPLAFFAAAAAAGCGSRPKVQATTTAARPVTVTLISAQRRAVERTVEVVGSLKGWEDVTVGSKRTGRVLKVRHDMGDRVNPGDLIVELDTIDADLAVERAQRSLAAELGKISLTEIPRGKFDESAVPSVAQARFALDKARQNLAREKALRQRGAGTAQDYQNAEIDEGAAQAALANAVVNVRTILDNALVAKVALDVARQQRADMEVRAPVPSATPPDLKTPLTYAISKRSVGEGQMLREGDAVAELVVENPLKIRMNVPERYSAGVRLKQEVRLGVAAYPGRAFVGRVTRINPTVDAVSRTFLVEATIPNDDGKLRPGGFAKASIVVDREDSALTVPIESVVRSVGVTKLFVVADDKTARSIAVETGLEGKGWIEVIGAVPLGAKVVATGQSQLADRVPVIVRDAPEPPASSSPTAAKPPEHAG